MAECKSESKSNGKAGVRLVRNLTKTCGWVKVRISVRLRVRLVHVWNHTIRRPNTLLAGQRRKSLPTDKPMDGQALL